MYAAHASSYHHPIITYHKRRQAKPSQGKARLPADGDGDGDGDGAGGGGAGLAAPPWLTDCGTT